MPSLTARRWIRWFEDATERALKTFAQATLAALPLADSGLSIESFLEWEPWSVGLGAAALSYLSSLASKRTGNPSSASLVRD